MQRFEAYAATLEAIIKSDLPEESKRRLSRVIRLFPRKRRELLNAVEEHLVFAGLVQETESGLVFAEGSDGTFGSAWLLIIQALIAFLPMLLELLNK